MLIDILCRVFLNALMIVINKINLEPMRMNSLLSNVSALPILPFFKVLPFWMSQVGSADQAECE